MPSGRTTMLACLLGAALFGSVLGAAHADVTTSPGGDSPWTHRSGLQERANGTTVGTSSGPISVLAPAVLVVVLAVLGWIVSRRRRDRGS